ncbi:sarcosine oxidase subunit gamma [Tropicimonas sp. TH_r6]|uniref:sarcosine oxidase subunit gamma n=1 Tax=Tropicimonas sp. TH_r6 TaxID=3082085 RepID=UPI002953580C|nr:sarcosine oxidase subunit gamma [Tropicimonas sp. TH_r6]MDV7144868.1 sarcosine oxidase subunit gamma [Tropicimonas sp. TH_r6]
MLETRLDPCPALGAESAPVQIGAISLAETDLALASVAGFRGGAAEPLLAEFLGAPPPGPGGLVQSGALGCFWTGAGQWMLYAPHDTQEDLAARLAGQLQGVAAVTEQNDGWAGLDASGPNLPDAFERLVGFDIHAMQPGAAERCVIEHIGCFLLCLGPDRFRLLAARSYARSLHHAVETCLRAADAFRAQ